MGSLGNPKTWIPYMNTKDCSQGFCSLYCPQWCYIIFPPPPPFEFPDDDSSPNFSPLVVAIISILAGAFLLISYYAIISKFCGTENSSQERESTREDNEELEENHNTSIHQPWYVARAGLDENLIKSITVFKYKKGEGLIEGTDCSVCLSEFEENESLRLLPKCSHAFHLPCIDMWLKSHSNCPLCRANIVSISIPTIENSSNIVENSEETSFRNVGNDPDGRSDSTVIEINDGVYQQRVRRSVSLDYACRTLVSVADILQISQESASIEDFPATIGVGSSKQEASSNRIRGIHSPEAMKRSFSSGRFFLL